MKTERREADPAPALRKRNCGKCSTITIDTRSFFVGFYIWTQLSKVGFIVVLFSNVDVNAIGVQKAYVTDILPYNTLLKPNFSLGYCRS